MKKLLPLLLLILIGCSSPEPINYQMLVQRDGLYYLKDTNEIYSGPVFNIDGKSKGYIEKGKWNGEFEFYHSNGQLNGIGSYKDGDGSNPGDTGISRNGRDGPWKLYYENGQLQYDYTNIENGIITGDYKEFYENGQLEAEVNVKEDGIIHGLYNGFYENGQTRMSGNYKNGLQNGLWLTYYENGQIKIEGNYKDDKQEGIHKLYLESGQIKSEGTFKNGIEDGPSKSYYSNGQIKTSGNYKNGKRDGVHKAYLESGKHRGNTYFKNGEMISKKDYENSSSSGNSSPCSASASEVKRKALSHANANYYLAASFTGCRFETGQVKTNESGNAYYVSIYCGANNPIDYIYKCNNGNLELISVND